MNQSSRNRLIHGEDYVLVMEEVDSPIILHEMFHQMSSLISGGERISEEFGEAIPYMTRMQFVVIHYYDNFVSPRNFQGYAVVMMTEFPKGVNESTSDLVRAILDGATDDDIAKIFLIAARNDSDRSKFDVLTKVANNIVSSRVKSLRSI